MRGALAGGDGVVVTVDAAICGLRMRERYDYRTPGRGAVTGFALFRGDWVRYRFVSS